MLPAGQPGGLKGSFPKWISLPYREAEPAGRRASILRNEAYFSYAGMTKGEVEHRRWTFYEAVNICAENLPSAKKWGGEEFLLYEKGNDMYFSSQYSDHLPISCSFQAN